MLTAIGDLEIGEDLRDWILGHPPEARRQMSLTVMNRMVLRVLPLSVACDGAGTDPLICFWAAAAGYAAWTAPSEAVIGAAVHAGDAARRGGFAALGLATGAAYDGAGQDDEACADAAENLPYAIYQDFGGDISDASVPWAREDCAALSEGCDLKGAPLWTKMPPKISKAWDNATPALFDRGMEAWVRWYEAVLMGRPVPAEQIAKVVTLKHPDGPTEPWRVGEAYAALWIDSPERALQMSQAVFEQEIGGQPDA